MPQPALYLNEWSDLRSDYAALLQDPLEQLDEETDTMARRFIDSGIPFSEFEALHAETVHGWVGDKATQVRADSVRSHVLSAYDRAFLDFQKLAHRHRGDVSDRRETSQKMLNAADALATSRDNLRIEVSLQHRLLVERSAELETLNRKIAAQRDEMAGFLYAVSHDLKSPLNTVKGLLSLFIDDHDTAAVDLADIEAALATTSRTGVMLDALLSFSQSVDAKPDAETVDLDALVSEVFEDLNGDGADSRAEFVKDQLPKVSGSAFQLRLLFQNLISNGAKYCAEGQKPRIEVRNKGARGLGYVAIAVIDNGIGIDPAYHKNIFGLFKRLHVYEEYPGTGIGLALCQRVVMNHKGQIHLRSTPGEGSMFTVVLPV